MTSTRQGCVNLYQSSNNGIGNYLLDSNDNLIYPNIASPLSDSVLNNQEMQCMGYNPVSSGNPTLMTLDQWKNVWTNGVATTTTGSNISCADVFHQIIYDNASGLLVFNSANYQRVQNDFQFMFTRYFNTSSYDLVLPGQTNWNSMQSLLIGSCVQIPGACSLAQQFMCTTCSRTQIANNSDLLTLCGCYSPNLTLNGTSDISKQCDPLCDHSRVAQLVNNTTGSIIECNSAVCVMDNVTITAAKTLISGIDITQICPACVTSNDCKCIIDTSILNLANSIGIADTVSFGQYCPNATCLLIDDTTQTSQVVSCGNYIQPTISTYSSSIPLIIWVLAALLFVIALLAILAYSYAYENIEVDVPTIWQPVDLKGRHPISSKVY